jgi:hypothetical protein
MENGRTAVAAGAALLAVAMLVSAGALAGCDDEGSPTRASPSTTTSTAPRAASASPAGAGVMPAVLFSPSRGSMGGWNTSYTLGWQFRPKLDIAVIALGYVDPKQDGLVHAHRVGIFDAETDRLIVSVTVGPKSTLGGSFRWESLKTPAILRAGHSYLAAAEYKSGDEVRDGEAVWTPEVGHILTENGKDFTSSLSSKGLAAPHREAVWEGFLVPTFKFKPAPAGSPTP